MFESAGARSLLSVPMLKEGDVIGAIVIYRQEVRPFTERQIDLVTTFADQAVIAIENTRLLKELHERTDDLSESLQQQTATADVLKVISRSPGDLKPVFQAMLENATRICGAAFGSMLLCEDDGYRRVALHKRHWSPRCTRLRPSASRWRASAVRSLSPTEGARW